MGEEQEKNELGLERPPVAHEVVREKVYPEILGRRKFESDDDIEIGVSEDEVDWGEPTDAESFKKLKELASEFLNESGLEIDEINLNSIKSLAKRANDIFPFYDQYSGVATLPKQMENWRQNKDDEHELRMGLDCKLATVMTAMAVVELSKKLDQEIEVVLRTEFMGVHPYVWIKDQGNGENYRVDFILREPEESTPKKSFATRKERARWRKVRTQCIENVHPVSAIGVKVFEKNYSVEYKLTAESLNQLDKVFLRS